MRNPTTYRLSARKYDRMRADGLFDDDKVELLNGVLTMMTSGPGHDYAVSYLSRSLEDLLPRDRWSVREEKPIQLGRFWKPQPDIVVVRGTLRDFALRTPGRADVALVVEVSDTTYDKDTGIKLRRYQRCGLAIYWVVDLSRRRVEVREMTARGLTISDYYGESDDIPVTVDGREFGRISVRDLLP